LLYLAQKKPPVMAVNACMDRFVLIVTR
jgi:hypothetical protein